MAKLIKRVLGSSTGKVGDIVFKRYKNGEVFITTHKGSNTISESPNCVKNRAGFSKTLKFSKAVNSLPELRLIWNTSEIKGRSAYTKIIGFNIKLLKDSNPSQSNKITPLGFGILTRNLALSHNSVSLDIKIDENSSGILNKTYTVNFVIALLNQKQNIEEIIFPYVFATSVFNPENTSDFKNVTASFNTAQKQYLEEFTNAIVYVALTNTETKPFKHSSSFALLTDIIQ